ncbi:hypothetical protein WJX72_003005 [[Myrmecia] bisecta]|uniref:OTU domain-containing protein n=1 Tax=[Myrmecia] bisecta TaxID=41462 RepID=A0AAW1PJG6_9CHLO
MGRKGGGKKGFLKSAVRAGDAPEQDVVEPVPQRALQTDPGQVADTMDGPNSPAKEEKPVSKTPGKPATTTPAASARSAQTSTSDAGDSDQDSHEGETRGQMVQRHKKEMKAHKEKMKKLGKKHKDEIEKMDEQIEKRHEAELAAHDKAALCDSDAAVTKVQASLYATKLDSAAPVESKKATKAQKRREKQQQEEAEREARIADEQAELGDSQRVLEERALAETLEPLGLQLRDIPPDGHCLYRSVEDQLSLSHSGGQAPIGFQALRSKAAEYIRGHEAEYLPFVVPEDGDAADPHAFFQKYCREVEDTAAWGGQVELGALAHSLQRHIIVYSVGLPAVDMGIEYKGKAPSLRVCYQRHAWALGEHYNSVVPAASSAAGSEPEDVEDESESE